ncbi:glycine betaine ABC transporter substrate-binding protein [Streptomyces sp. 4N509B]|uniref:glycine betaine ABC transporter substrate-binding protein n=1 Tax=Streptomyces sp. 4N509B TaxID=3457413 RepID=UPI003FD186BF
MGHTRRTLHALATLPLLLAATACSMLAEAEEEPSGAAGDFEMVVLAMPDWTGGQATAAVAAHVLENELDVPVELRRGDQETSWDQLASGGVDAILEDWGALPDRRELYVERKGNVTDAGPLGITGGVGWYVTRQFAEAHPEVLHAENLNAFADDLDGELLHADPFYATRDEEILDELGLDLRPVAVGSEEALLTEVTRSSLVGTPTLTYLWEPHWVFTEADLTEVELPDPQAAYYPDIELRKYLNTYFLDHGGQAAAFLRDFTLTASEQNAVARLVAEEGYTPRAAAEEWASHHPERVQEWLNADGQALGG